MRKGERERVCVRERERGRRKWNGTRRWFKRGQIL